MFLKGCERAGLHRGEFKVMVRGDDMFSWVPAWAHAIIVQSYRDGGFVPKVKSGHKTCDCRFCSNAFYPCKHPDPTITYLPAPTFKAFLKLFFTVHTLSERQWASHVRGVCLGLINTVKHVPIFYEHLQTQIAYTSRKACDAKTTQAAIQEARIKYMQGSKLASEHPITANYIAEMYRQPLAVIDKLRHLVTTWGPAGIYHDCDLMHFVHAVMEVET